MNARSRILIPAILALCFLALHASPALAQTPNPVPFLNEPLIPTAVVPGRAAFVLTVNGTHFVSASTVNWNGSPRVTTFIGSSQLTAMITAADVATAGTASVTVVSPGPGGGRSNVAFFQVTSPVSSFALGNNSAPAEASPFFVVSADFNHDGKLDLAVLTSTGSSSGVAVLLGKGDGTFEFPVFYTDNVNGGSLAVADFNGDGNLDLAITGSSTGTIDIRLGNGDGTFQPAVQYPAGSVPSTVVAADFNGDGKIDLVVGNGNSSSSGDILLGNGDGTFQAPVSVALTSHFVGSIVAGDFNGDNNLDLAVLDGLGSVSIVLGNGDGTFQPPVSYVIQSSGSGLAAADFNGDGKLDLAASDGNGYLVVLLGNGDGTFGEPVNYPAISGVSALTVGDFNGDGKLDVALVAFSVPPSAVTILRGNGDGTFQPALKFGSAPFVNGIVAGDFNGDGLLDLATLTGGLHSVDVLLSTSLEVTPVDEAFGYQGVSITSPPRHVILQNLGVASLSIAGISTTGSFPQTNTCGASLAAGAKCIISVTFKPATTGTFTGTLTITDTAVGSPQKIGLIGHGTFLNARPQIVNFGPVTVGMTSGPQTIVFTNLGHPRIGFSFQRITGNEAQDFALTQQCEGRPLNHGQSCGVTVTFTPKALGARAALFILADNGGVEQTVQLEGTGK